MQLPLVKLARGAVESVLVALENKLGIISNTSIHIGKGSYMRFRKGPSRHHSFSLIIADVDSLKLLF